jgi:hypothetical protein
VNAGYLGEYLVDRDTAMARVEKDIEHAMEMVLHDWAVSESAGAAVGASRTSPPALIPSMFTTGTMAPMIGVAHGLHLKARTVNRGEAWTPLGPRKAQTGAQVLGVFHRIREEEHRAVVDCLSDVIDDELVAVLVVGHSSQRTFRKFIEPAEMVQLFRRKREGYIVRERFGFDRGKYAVSAQPLIELWLLRRGGQHGSAKPIGEPPLLFLVCAPERRGRKPDDHPR